MGQVKWIATKNMGNIVDFPDPSTIEQEACAWVVKLDGEQPLSQEDRASLIEWINRSPLHREKIESLSGLWGEFNVLTELAIPLEKNTAVAPKKPIFSALFSPIYAISTIALVAFVSVFISTGLHKSDTLPPTSFVYSTLVGEQKIATLPDGSIVHLNTNSQVEVDYSDQRRKVRLLRGEVHFEVEKDTDRPFLVYAETSLVRALGTAFAVYLRDRNVEVTITEGTVELTLALDKAVQPNSDLSLTPSTTMPIATPLSNKQSIILNAGQQASVNHTIHSVQLIDNEDIVRKLSWREGKLSFSGEPLKEVVEQISRYTSVSIVIADPAIEAIQIGGYFGVDEIDALFGVLETSFNIKVDRIDNNRILLSSINP